MKHTPGPWNVSIYCENGDRYTLANPRNKPPLYWHYQLYENETDVQAKANARLIAAAPDLLANLENLLAAIEAGITTETMLGCAWNESSYIAQAKKAIQKAAGE